jgi:hypothetical protein
VSDEELGEVRCTPTDPSIEFDIIEAVRLRLVEVLTREGHGLIEAERVALYVVGCARPISRLLKAVTGGELASQQEVLEALLQVLDEAPALEKARRIKLRLEGESDG